MTPTRPKNKVWAYFDVSSQPDKMATCKLCHKDYSFKTTVCNLKKHLSFKHSDQVSAEFLEDDNNSVCETKMTTDGFSLKRRSTDSIEEYNEQGDDAGAGDNDDKDWKMEDLLKIAKQKRKGNWKGSKRTSTLWHFFDISKKEERKAECRMCHAELSYKTSIGNLKTHLHNRHPSVLKELKHMPSFTDSVVEDGCDENGALSDGGGCNDEYSINDYEVLEEVLVPDTLEAGDDNDAVEGGDETCEKDTLTSMPSYRVRVKNTKTLESIPYSSRPGTKRNLEPVDKWARSCEKFGAYVASLMLQIPRHVAANYQVQIVKRLMDESMKYGDNADL